MSDNYRDRESRECCERARRRGKCDCWKQGARQGYRAGRDATLVEREAAVLDDEVMGSRWEDAVVRPGDGRRFVVRLVLAERGTPRHYEWEDTYAPLTALTEVLPGLCEMMASEPGEEDEDV